MPALRTSATAPALWVIAIVAILYLLREAQSLLIPIAIGVLLSYTLEPLVKFLERRHVPRLVGATLVVVSTFGVTGWGVYAMGDQIVAGTEALPQAARQFRATVLKPGSGPTANVREAVRELTTRRRAAAESGAAVSSPQGQAVPADPPSPANSGGSENNPLVGSAAVTGVLQYAAFSVLAIIGDLTVVVFLVFFLLISGPGLRRRALEVAWRHGDHREVLARIIDDVDEQVQRFLVVRLITALAVALATWAVLAWMNVEQAAFWGFTAGAANSIPYFGPIIVSGGLVVVGLVQEGDLVRGVTIAGAALVITSIEGWLLTPPLLGKAERMNVVTIFLGLLVWTWIWGPWGTILAVPMLVVLKAVADHVEALKPLGRLMGPL